MISDREGRYRHIGVYPGGHYLEVTIEADDEVFGRANLAPFETESGERHAFDLRLKKLSNK